MDQYAYWGGAGLIAIGLLAMYLVYFFAKRNTNQPERGGRRMNPEHITAQIVLRSWPFGRGVGKIMNTFFPNRSFREDISTVKTSDGTSIKVCPNDLLGRHLYLTGEYEHSVLDVLFDLAVAGDVLLDIGANIGYISSSFLHQVQASEVIAVEPQAGTVGTLLQANLSQFQGRYRIFPFALSEKPGRAKFRVSDGNLGDGRISETGDFEIATERGDTLLTNVNKIDLVKIDIQGHELEALRSMRATLERLKPRAIIFEDDGGQLVEIAEFLADLNYHVQGIQKVVLGKFRICDIAAGHRCDNFIASLSST
jgi:FkbM family methyltransferase